MASGILKIGKWGPKYIAYFIATLERVVGFYGVNIGRYRDRQRDACQWIEGAEALVWAYDKTDFLVGFPFSCGLRACVGRFQSAARKGQMTGPGIPLAAAPLDKEEVEAARAGAKDKGDRRLRDVVFECRLVDGLAELLLEVFKDGIQVNSNCWDSSGDSVLSESFCGTMSIGLAVREAR